MRDFVSYNRKYYNNKNSNLDVDSSLKKLSNYLENFDQLIKSTASWQPFWANNFATQLANKRVLEIGAGDFLTSILMAKFGAHVVANELSDSHKNYAYELAEAMKIDNIDFCFGDFLEMNFEQHMQSFDFIVGKAVIHHLNHVQEEGLYKKCVTLLKNSGICRFSEPKVEFPRLQFLIPVVGRPSCLNHRSFKRWKEYDVHPHRDNSSKHYREVC